MDAPNMHNYTAMTTKAPKPRNSAIDAPKDAYCNGNQSTKTPGVELVSDGCKMILLSKGSIDHLSLTDMLCHKGDSARQMGKK
jgi:hypothetical protein